MVREIPLPVRRVVAGRFVRAVAVVVAGNRLSAKDHDELVADVPGSGFQPVHGHVGDAITVVIRGDGLVATIAELDGELVPHEPDAGRRPVHGDVCGAVAVVVARNGDVPLVSKLHGQQIANVPGAGRWPVDGEIGRPVAVVVAGNRNVAHVAELDLEFIADPPGPGCGAIHRDVVHAVAVEVGRGARVREPAAGSRRSEIRLRLLREPDRRGFRCSTPSGQPGWKCP